VTSRYSELPVVKHERRWNARLFTHSQTREEGGIYLVESILQVRLLLFSQVAMYGALLWFWTVAVSHRSHQNQWLCGCSNPSNQWSILVQYSQGPSGPGCSLCVHWREPQYSKKLQEMPTLDYEIGFVLDDLPKSRLIMHVFWAKESRPGWSMRFSTLGILNIFPCVTFSAWSGFIRISHAVSAWRNIP
jgi:hypothetical protein